MKKYWISVASREHVMCGVRGGFAQVCHGKVGALARMKPGDSIIYYSPVEVFGEKTPCRRFTAIGIIDNSEPYQHAMSASCVPWRRNVSFVPAREVSIEPMIEKLSFIINKQRWGFLFRQGCFSISSTDFEYICTQMGVSIT